ncbi:MAG TPA: hypothetical protein VMB75_00535 [Rhodocyclaceae bacterium]|nr:hypothetical protein [Rhodocyclaceae bacterium]
MFSPDLIQWLAFGLGTAGSILWASNGPWSKYAAAFWLAASLLWVWFARQSGHPGLMARDLISIVTALWGAWRWLPAGAARRSP